MSEEKKLVNNMSPKNFMKVLPKELEKNGIKYKEGPITDKVPFNPQQCVAGGIHYCQEEDIMEWFWLGEYVADVDVPSYAQTKCYGNKYKSSVIILSNIRHISDYMDKKYPTIEGKYHPVILSWLDKDYRNIRYLKQQTPEICKKMLDVSNGSAIVFIRNPTKDYWIKALSMNGSLISQLLPDICEQKWSYNDSYDFFKTSVSNCGYNIRYVPKDFIYDDLREIAVNQNPSCIYCIPNPSEELCQLAIRQKPTYITYIKNPSYELCVLAVSTSYNALAYINNPSKDLCLIALKQSDLAISMIPSNLRQDKDIIELVKRHQLKLK